MIASRDQVWEVTWWVAVSSVALWVTLVLLASSAWGEG
jgi:hypothetical protein